MSPGMLLMVEVRANFRQASGEAEQDFDLWELEREMWHAQGCPE